MNSGDPTTLLQSIIFWFLILPCFIGLIVAAVYLYIGIKQQTPRKIGIDLGAKRPEK